MIVRAVVHREACGRTLTHHDDPEPVVRPFAQLVEVGAPLVLEILVSARAVDLHDELAVEVPAQHELCGR